MLKRSKMRAGVLCMLMVCLSDEKISPQNCKDVTLVTLSKASIVSVPCPPVWNNISQLKYVLLFNGNRIHQIMLNKSLRPEDSLFSGLFQIAANSSGVYVCKREVLYPPPYQEECHSTEVVMEEAEPLPLVNWTNPNANLSCPPSIPGMMLWAGSGVLLLYSLLIHAVAIALWRKMKSRKKLDDANLYMNVRPMKTPYKPKESSS